MTDDSSLMEYDPYQRGDEALLEAIYGDHWQPPPLSDRDSFSKISKLDISYMSELDDIGEVDETNLDEGDEEEEDSSIASLSTPFFSPIMFIALALHKVYQKSSYRTMLHTFLYWKTISASSFHAQLTQNQSEQLTSSYIWTQDYSTIRMKAHLYVSDESANTALENKLHNVFNHLLFSVDKCKKKRIIYDKFSIWRDQNRRQKEQIQQCPLQLRLLTSMQHNLLWKVFCEYCSKKKKLPNYEKPKKFFGFQMSKSSTASQSTQNNDDGEYHYHKLILSVSDIMKLMQDLDLHHYFSQDRVETTLQNIAHADSLILENMIHMDRENMSVNSNDMPPKLLKRKSKSSLFSSFFSMKSSDHNNINKERISFNTFNKMLWTLQLECVHSKLTTQNILIMKEMMQRDPDPAFKKLKGKISSTDQVVDLLK